MTVDPLDNLFDDIYNSSVVPQALDSIEQAIGVFEHFLEDDGLIRMPSKETIDIETAIERALRPTFRSDPPKSEREVQRCDREHSTRFRSRLQQRH